MADTGGTRGQRAGLADRQEGSGVGEPPVHSGWLALMIVILIAAPWSLAAFFQSSATPSERGTS